MKKSMLSIVLAALLMAPSVLMAYGWGDLKTDIVTDTKEVLGKNLKAVYFLDTLADSSEKHKVGVSAPILSWKFLSLEPAFIYTPNTANQVGEFGFCVPIRLGRIPISNGMNIEQWVKETFGESSKQGGWIDHLFAGPYTSRSLSKNAWGLGVVGGFSFQW